MERRDFALSLNEMAATLAHEVRNPLALAIANLKMLELDCSDTTTMSRLCVIKRELYKIGDIIAELVELAVPSQEEESCNILSLIRQIVTPFAQTYTGDITFNMPSYDDVSVKGAPGRLRLVISNIIKNAVEAIKTPNGPLYGQGRVDITMSCDRRMAVITVKDNGIGMDDEIAAQVTAARYTTKEQGTGIGLFAACAISEQYGGKLSISGIPGMGCTVKLELLRDIL